jgi:hypothetical protein
MPPPPFLMDPSPRKRGEGVGAEAARCLKGDEMEGGGVKSDSGARAGVEERTSHVAMVAERGKGRRERGG